MLTLHEQSSRNQKASIRKRKRKPTTAAASVAIVGSAIPSGEIERRCKPRRN
jgi:hypothetical protein